MEMREVWRRTTVGRVGGQWLDRDMWDLALLTLGCVFAGADVVDMVAILGFAIGAS